MLVHLNRVIGACLDLGLPWDYLLWVYLNETSSTQGRPRTNRSQNYIHAKVALTPLLQAARILARLDVIPSRSLPRLFSLLYRTGCNYTQREVPASVRRDVVRFLRTQDRYDMIIHPNYLWLVQ